MNTTRYKKALTHSLDLNVPMNVYERGRCKLGATLDASLQPFELCFLARQIVSVLERRYGRNLAFKDIRRLLRHAMDFRDRFWEVMNLARCEIVESGQPRGSAVAIVLPYMGLCHEDYDAHIRALRHLWFGPTGDVRVDEDWYFDIPESERRRFLAGQYAIAALLYVDAAQLAAVRHKNGVDTVNYALRAASAMQRAIEFDSLSPEQLRTEMAREAAIKRHRTSPKSAAKARVYARWENWKANRERHRSIAQFAQVMVNAFPEIENPQTVERWVRAWRKDKGSPSGE
ncbi:Uncharacterised protein [Burkholderia pseudomallei]|nr:Uncharacterised protein [Burkholderia pseudomallei]CAJ3129153.1 Uncharacterised protein [Burkholderia pseudomallei]CAJ3223897.1 Uncharacterised protein [Burkholderia pseudomallei]CAJ3560921.1 Uncharacterised protein [Burkholderia pseudomallei]CAJ3763536.1 Uncharacterised protein [Burkholderia pseudomallei]